MKKTNLIGGLLLLLSMQSFAQTKLILVKPAESKTWGYANEKGDMVIPARYEKCMDFTQDGFAVVQDIDSKQYHFINTKGEKLKTVISEFSLKSEAGFGLIAGIEGFSDGLVAIRTKDDKWGFLNTKGEWAIQPKYTDVKSFSEGFASVRLGDKPLIIDKKGTEIEIKSTEPIVSVNKFAEGLAPFKTKTDMVGFIGTDGTVKIAPAYKSVGFFVHGLAWFKTADGMVGFINTKGEQVIKPQYKAAKDFDETGSIARVKTDAEWFFINTKGETITNIPFENKAVGDFSDGLARVKQGEMVGFINTNGEWVIKPAYKGVREFHNGYAAVKTGELWGLINSKGETVTQPKYIGIKDVEVVK